MVSFGNLYMVSADKLLRTIIEQGYIVHGNNITHTQIIPNGPIVYYVCLSPFCIFYGFEVILIRWHGDVEKSHFKNWEMIGCNNDINF